MIKPTSEIEWKWYTFDKKIPKESNLKNYVCDIFRVMMKTASYGDLLITNCSRKTIYIYTIDLRSG